MALVVIIGLVVLYVVQYFQYRTSPEYLVEKNMKELERRYAEDQYGGETPEETLRLFIDALKKGDIDLASKYFVLDKQKEWRNELLIIKEKGLLDEMVKDLGKTRLSVDESTAFFILLRDDGFESQLVMHKHPLNNRWKIYEL